MWTHFWDMHSGGRQKLKWAHIYIEADGPEARIIFYNRFKRNPERVTCTCCGSDYSISSEESLRMLTGFQRGCRSLETPRDPKTGLYLNDDPVLKAHLYLEDDEEPPEGYSVSKLSAHRTNGYQTLEAYCKSKDVLVIRFAGIKPKERKGEVPVEGYVWQE